MSASDGSLRLAERGEGGEYFLDELSGPFRVEGDLLDPRFPQFPHLYHIRTLELCDQERDRIYQARGLTPGTLMEDDLVLVTKSYKDIDFSILVPEGVTIHIRTHLSSKGGATIWARHEVVSGDDPQSPDAPVAASIKCKLGIAKQNPDTLTLRPARLPLAYLNRFLGH